MGKAVFASLLLAVSLAACGGGAGGALPSTAASTSRVTVQPSPSASASATPSASPSSAPQASGRIAFGDPTFSAPSFNANNEMESGSCSSQVAFTGTSEWATFAISENGYSGAFSVSEATDPASPVQTAVGNIISSVLSGSTLTVTTNGAGLADVTVSDTLGHSATCQVGVTVTTATLDDGARK